jgi:hypothetical protein
MERLQGLPLPAPEGTRRHLDVDGSAAHLLAYSSWSESWCGRSGATLCCSATKTGAAARLCTAQSVTQPGGLPLEI